MAQVFGFLLLAVLAIYALKMAIVLLLLAGLIFRTKQTLGLLLFGGFMTALGSAPFITLGVVAILVTISLMLKAKEKKATALALEQPGSDAEDT